MNDRAKLEADIALTRAQLGQTVEALCGGAADPARLTDIAMDARTSRGPSGLGVNNAGSSLKSRTRRPLLAQIAIALIVALIVLRLVNRDRD